MKFKKELIIPITSNVKSYRNFEYIKGSTSLKFSLGLEKKELDGFLECLNMAIVDIKKTLEEL